MKGDSAKIKLLKQTHELEVNNRHFSGAMGWLSQLDLVLFILVILIILNIKSFSERVWDIWKILQL